MKIEVQRKGDITKMEYLDQGQVDFIKKSNNKFHEYNMLEAISSMELRKGLFIDIGAHVGNHSVFFAKYCKQATRVLSFEPSTAFETLKKNTKRFDNIEIKNEAVGNYNGFCSIDYNETNPGQTKVDTTPGETPINTLPKKLPFTTLIKIDVEEMELETVQGCMFIIKRDFPDLFIETFNDPKLISEILPSSYRLIKRYNNAPTYHFRHQ